MDGNDIYKEFDLVKLGLLPDKWVEEIESVSESHSLRTLLEGTSVTSREPAGSSPVEVNVVTGDSIRQGIPWLHRLYHDQLPVLARALKNREVVASHDLESGVNINILRGVGSRYEWHVDSNPVTGLLFVTTHREGDGGELVFKLSNELINVYPKSGMFIVFDAREIPHTVMPLLRSEYRISVPMNFYFADGSQDRPSDLASYLYSQA